MAQQIRLRRKALAFLFLIGTWALASAIEPNKLIGKDYASARRLLIKSGWKTDTSTKVIDTEMEIKRRYPELDACASDGPFCSFTFRRAKECIRVVTTGEEAKSFVVKGIASDC